MLTRFDLHPLAINSRTYLHKQQRLLTVVHIFINSSSALNIPKICEEYPVVGLGSRSATAPEVQSYGQDLFL